MIDAYQDYNGVVHIYHTSDLRQGPPGRRGGRGNGRRRPPPIVVHQPTRNQPWQQPQPQPWQQPQPNPPPVAPQPPPIQVATTQGVDMRTALDALGALIPAAGKMIAAFRHAPDRPTLSGDMAKDMASLLDYVVETFDYKRGGDQTASVLATTGAVLEILAAL